MANAANPMHHTRPAHVLVLDEAEFNVINLFLYTVRDNPELIKKLAVDEVGSWGGPESEEILAGLWHKVHFGK